MVELLQGFVLTRHWRDTPAGTEVAFWDHLGEFLKVGDKMTLTAHDIASISEELMRVGVCDSMQAAGRASWKSS
ncbi:hypothetical protein K3Z99_26710, partial [Pseudomonas aeruginosa]|nr:hypothetical protein [Pseudomonas aeruginosa]